jgi:hypothetical protein
MGIHADTLRKHGALLLLVGAVATITIVGSTPRLRALLASTTSSLQTTPGTVYLTAEKDTLIPLGTTRDVDININARTPINTVGITLLYPTDYIEVVGISKEKSFLDLWTEETAIKEDVGQIHFSGGTYKTGGLTGTSTALSITVRAKKAGEATLSFAEVLVYPSDGSGTPLEVTKRTLTLSIPEAAPGAAGSAAPPQEPRKEVAAPSPDFNGDGIVSVVDISILAFKILGAYDPRYDLDRNGSLGLSDLSVIFAHTR